MPGSNVKSDEPRLGRGAKLLFSVAHVTQLDHKVPTRPHRSGARLLDAGVRVPRWVSDADWRLWECAGGVAQGCAGKERGGEGGGEGGGRHGA